METLARIQDIDDPAFDPLDESDDFGDVVNFHEVMRDAWKKGGPVQRGSFRQLSGLETDVSVREDEGVFMVFGNQNIRRIQDDAETFSQDLLKRGFRQSFGPSISQMNPPEHTMYRRIFQKAFLPGVIQQWSDWLVEPVVRETIAKFKDDDKTEIIHAFAYPYPFEIICRQLDLPEADRPVFLKLAATSGLFQSRLDKAIEAGQKLGAYIKLLVEEKRRNPSNDLVSILVNAEHDGQFLPEEPMISFLRQLMNAAGDTTFRSTGNMLVALLRDRPDQYQMLLKDRSLVPVAVEETLRLYGPLPMGSRSVTKDVEIEGVKIPAGSIVEPAIGLIGRDPDVFENPDLFDVTRTNSKRHMTFGQGPHICIGQHLARLEMTRALNAILDHFPNLRLDPDYPAPQIYGVNFLSPRQMHVLLH